MNNEKAKEIAEYLDNTLNVKGVLELSKDKPFYLFKTDKGIEIGLYMWVHKGKIFVSDLINGGYYGDENFDSKIQEIISGTEEWVESCIRRQKERRENNSSDGVILTFWEAYFSL